MDLIFQTARLKLRVINGTTKLMLTTVYIISTVNSELLSETDFSQFLYRYYAIRILLPTRIFSKC